MADAGVVAGDGQVRGALLDQPVDQGVGLADSAEPTEQDDGAILDAGHGIGHGLDDLVDHLRRFLDARLSGWCSATEPLCQGARPGSVRQRGAPGAIGG